MEGLEKFREAFETYSENYVIIGGTACEIAMAGTAVRPRATHDIDMIVIVEKMTADFAEHFWQFVREGGYHPEKRKLTEGEKPKYELYRFVNGHPGYPEMIELLARHPDILGEPKGLTIEPLPTGEDMSSLSAIIMDDNYYHFTIEHSKLTNGIRHATPAALIALKARAYLNLLHDKADGKHVNSKDIRKHRSDVLKNVVIMEDSQITAPGPIVDCIKEFVDSIRNEWDILSEPLAKALDQNTTFIEALLEQLDGIFLKEQS
jgi:hypothetical protein